MRLSNRGIFPLFGTTALVLGASFAVAFWTGEQALHALRQVVAATGGASAHWRWFQQDQASETRRVVVFLITIGLDLIYLAWFFRTISREMRAREEARRATARDREQFATTLASIGDGVLVTDPQGAVTFLNREAERLTGWSLADAAGQPSSRVMVLAHARTRQPVPNPVELVLREGKPAALGRHTVLISKFGAETPVADGAFPIRQEGGALFGAVLVVRDVSAQRRNEEAQARLAAIVESSQDAIVSQDFEGVIRTWNGAAQRMFGYTADEAIGQPITIIVPQDRRAEDSDVLSRIQQGQPVDVFETVRRRKDGTHLEVSVTVSPIVDPDGTLIGASKIARDISAAKRFEAELRTRVAERTQELSEKTALLEGFIYTVAHDLRAPLRAIHGYAEFLAEDLAAQGGAKTGDNLERIKVAAQRMDRLIRDLLTFSRVTQVEIVLENVPLERAIATAERELESEIQRAGAVIETARPLGCVRAEPAILDQVLINLVSNAIKFVAPGVRPRVRIATERRDGFLRLSIADNGIGIPPQYHSRVFKVFERLRAAQGYPGTGVGLAIVARAADRLGGKVGLQSEPGKGSTFWIDLPEAAS